MDLAPNGIPFDAKLFWKVLLHWQFSSVILLRYYRFNPHFFCTIVEYELDMWLYPLIPRHPSDWMFVSQREIISLLCVDLLTNCIWLEIIWNNIFIIVMNTINLCTNWSLYSCNCIYFPNKDIIAYFRKNMHGFSYIYYFG